MKKLITFLLLIFSLTLTTYATNNIVVTLNDKTLEFDQQPIIEDGRTLVPMRKIFEEMGAVIEWQAETRTVIAKKELNTIIIIIDSNVAIVNNEPKILDVSAKLINGRTLVPLRFVSEALNCEVNWDENTRTVTIKNVVEILNGLGKTYYPSGSVKYEGGFVSGKLEGEGIYYYENGKIAFKGMYKSGIRNGYGKAYDLDENLLYDGNYKDDKYEGFGKLYVNGKILYEGSFKNDIFEGYGKYYINGKLVYYGEFKLGKFNGYGTFYYENGDVMYVGIFSDGTFVHE